MPAPLAAKTRAAARTERVQGQQLRLKRRLKRQPAAPGRPAARRAAPARCLRALPAAAREAPRQREGRPRRAPLRRRKRTTACAAAPRAGGNHRRALYRLRQRAGHPALRRPGAAQRQQGQPGSLLAAPARRETRAQQPARPQGAAAAAARANARSEAAAAPRSATRALPPQPPQPVPPCAPARALRAAPQAHCGACRVASRQRLRVQRGAKR
jgi:hypothetical protein